jgi:hypothetical protein
MLRSCEETRLTTFDIVNHYREATMTTIFVFGNMPDNHVRSFIGAMGIEAPTVYRPGQEFLDASNAKRDELASVLNEVRERCGYQSDAAREASRIYNQKRSEFALEYFDVDDVVHILGYPDILSPGFEVHCIVVNERGNVRTGRESYTWTYHPYNPDVYREAYARLTGGRLLDKNVRLEYELVFRTAVDVSLDVVTTHDWSSKTSEKTHRTTTERYEWRWDVPIDPVISHQLSELSDRIRSMEDDNSYGFDHDTSWAYAETYGLIAGIG